METLIPIGILSLFVGLAFWEIHLVSKRLDNFVKGNNRDS